VSKPRGEINYIGECGSESYKCGLCEGDCDSDSDCEGDLVCISREGHDAVPGCTGEGNASDMFGKDICVPQGPPVEFINSLTYNESGCSASNPCTKCEGPCVTNNSCGIGFVCFTRSGLEPVPGCVTGSDGDISGVNYCHEEPTSGMPTYIPGDLTKIENGLLLSTGLTARVIATAGSKVSYINGGQSLIDFHGYPDAGAVFSVTTGPNIGG
jgi:hypothetical protein